MSAHRGLLAALLLCAGCGGADACSGSSAEMLSVGWFAVKGAFNDFATSPVPLISPPQGGGAGVLAALRARGLAPGTYHLVIDVAVDGLAVMSSGGDVSARLKCQSSYAVSQNLPILLPGTAFADLEGKTAHVDMTLMGPAGAQGHVVGSNVIATVDGM